MDKKEQEELEKEFKKHIKAKRGEFGRRTIDSNKFEDSLFELLHKDTQVDPDLRGLFHRLNYERAVKDIKFSMHLWLGLLLVFSFTIIVTMVLWSQGWDKIVPNAKDNVLTEYEQLLSSVDLEINWQKKGHVIYPNINPDKPLPEDSTLVELAITKLTPKAANNQDIESLKDITKSFWEVYFFRYMLIRIFVAIILLLLINTGLKVYVQLRKYKMSLIYNEEATTVSRYFILKFLGTEKLEKKAKRDEQGKETGEFEEKRKVIFTKGDKNRVAKLLPLILQPLYDIPDDKGRKRKEDSIINRLLQMMESIVSLKKGTDK